MSFDNASREKGIEVSSTIEVQSIRYGEQQWQKRDGKYFVMMWGWWPYSNGTPSWKWVHVEHDRVPGEVERFFNRVCGKGSR